MRVGLGAKLSHEREWLKISLPPGFTIRAIGLGKLAMNPHSEMGRHGTIGDTPGTRRLRRFRVRMIWGEKM